MSPTETTVDERTVENPVLHRAAEYGSVELVAFLVRCGQKINSFWEDPTLLKVTPLQKAAKSGKADIVEFLLRNGAGVDDRQGRTRTALHFACEAGHYKTVAVLLQFGAHTASRCSWTLLGTEAFGGTDSVQAIHVASIAGHQDIVAILLENGARVTQQTDQGLSALILAAHFGRLSVVKYLVTQAGASVRAEGSHGETALHAACRRGLHGVARFLVENGADISAKCTHKIIHGSTPLQRAACARGDHAELVAYLVENGAAVSAKTTKKNILPIHYAAMRGNINVIECLLEHGASINDVDSYWRTPLHWASKEGKVSVVQYLIQRGARGLPKDRAGSTPLHLAAKHGKNGRLEVATYLVENTKHDNPLAQVNFEGETALHIAARRAKKKMFYYLIRAGIDVNAADYKGVTALHHAAQSCEENEVEHLLLQGVEVSPRTRDGDTPLHSAIRLKRKRVAVCLINNGAHLDVGNNRGDSPLHRAIVLNYLDLAELLVYSGADPCIRNIYGRTPLHSAISAQFPAHAVRKMLQASKVRWLEPTGIAQGEMPKTHYREDIIPTRDADPLIEILTKLSWPKENASKHDAYTEALAICKTISWPEKAHQLTKYCTRTTADWTPEDFLRTFGATEGALIDNKHLAELHGGLYLYLRVVAEAAAASNVTLALDRNRRESVSHYEIDYLSFLDNAALEATVRHHKDLTNNQLWFFIYRTAADAYCRSNMYPGNYLTRWRQFATDIIRHRNSWLRVWRTLQGCLPVEIITLVWRNVLESDGLPQQSEYETTWLCPKPSHPPETLIYELTTDLATDDHGHGRVTWDPVNRKWAWVVDWAFNGFVVFGYEPGLLYDSAKRRWIHNEKHHAVLQHTHNVNAQAAAHQMSLAQALNG